MKSKNHQDPIQQLADRLREHAVPYREGAWEQFKAKERKKKMPRVLWPYFSAAAVLLLAIILFRPAIEKESMSLEVATLSQSPEEISGGKAPQVENRVETKEGIQSLSSKGDSDRVYSESAVSPKVKTRLALAEDNTGESNERALLSNLNTLEARAVSLPKESQQDMLDNEAESSVQGLPNERFTDHRTGENKPRVPAIEKVGPTDFLTELLKIEEQGMPVLNARADKKWSVGLNVSPNMSANKHVNMGGGVALAYALSPKVSISSGVSYLQLDAERGVSGPDVYSSPSPGTVRINVQNKTLEKVQANLIGLDIPLNLNYQLTNRIFTSVGISVFGVLNENGSRQYLNEMATMAYAFGDTKTPEPVVRTFSSKEATQEKMYEGKNLSGFFNFSVGYSIPFSKKVGFSIEPFVKIPMGYVSSEELNLSNGGVKVSTRF